ncbi:MAG: glycosyltransferase [Ignavibacteriales bacterium]|nr:glycosyltransferase [Ignavibacteriales bacterium]
MPSRKPSEAAPQLSVVIVNYNVREFLHQALASLFKALKGIRAEVFVVDNASDDGSVEMIRSTFPSVRLLVNKSNTGFGRANNQALRQARGRYLLLMNPDTVIQEDTVRVLLRFFEDHPDAGCAGCMILNPDGTFQLACRRSFPTIWTAFTKISGLSALFPKSKLFGRYNLTYLSPHETYEVDAVSGSFMMVRREAYEATGGLDESFFMYGEDLDWCYRIKKAGWNTYYVPSTRIIHYKGESTRRSAIDEVKTFYDAMHIYVTKHLRGSSLMHVLLRLGIVLSSRLASIRHVLRPVRFAVLDVVLVVLSLMVAELLRMGQFFYFPAYAYPAVYTVPAVLIISGLFLTGVYTHHPLSVSRTAAVVFTSYVVVSALVAFFKDYAFSRLVIVMSGVFTMALLPGWRLLVRLRKPHGTLFGRRTLIVGTDDSARKLKKRLEQKPGEEHSVVGFVDRGRRRVGERVDGTPIVGSMDNVGKLVYEHGIQDVIFSTDGLSYMDILSVMSRAGNRSVNYYLVPDTLEVMIGKAGVDSLGDIPLVQISNNIDRRLNRLTKRLMDVAIAGVLLLSVYPFVYFKSVLSGSSTSTFILGLPDVLKGRKSLVGPPERAMAAFSRNGSPPPPVNLGKPGLTGLVQLQRDRELTREEVGRTAVSYARNQSVWLDLEILLEAMLGRTKTKDDVHEGRN